MTLTRCAVALAAAALLSLAACARSSVIPLADNAVQVMVDAAPACGPDGAQELAFQQAAVATIRRGYDKFVVAGIDRDARTSFITHSPSIERTQGTTSYTMPTFSGVFSRHQAVLTVWMFAAGDPDADQALDARGILGPEWREIVAEDDPTFC